MGTLEAVAFDPDGFYVFWRERGELFLSREEAEGWAKRREHHYPEGWRVFCHALPPASSLTQLLRERCP